MDKTQSRPSFDQKENVSLKEFVVIVQEWIWYLWTKKVWIILFGVIGAAIGFTMGLMQRPAYEAELTFILEDSKTSSLAGFAGLASQFGIDLGANGSGVFEGDNILDFMQSRLMVEKTLLSPINEKQTLADYFIDVKKLREKWAKKRPEMKDINFPLGQSRGKFTRIQDSVLNTLYTTITSKHLTVSKTYKTSSFILVKCVSADELFSKTFTERIVKEATDFYVQTKTQRAKITVDKIQATADSIEIQLNKKTYALAYTQDRNLNPMMNSAAVNVELLGRDKLVLQTMYGEVVKNLELSKLTMMQETPIIQIVDTPILPLENKNMGKLLTLVIGGFVGGFLTVGFFIIRMVWIKIMK